MYNLRMDVDEVWTHIGEFGPSQKLIFYCLCLVQVFASLQVFVFSFIGVDPGWRCKMLSTTMDDSITVLEDPSAKCLHYQQGECVPEYSKEFTSIVTEWDLICSKAALPNLSQSAFFFGNLLGLWLFGTLSDMFGRRKIFFLGFLAMTLSSIVCGLSPGFYTFTLFRVITSGWAAGILATYVLSMEIIGTSYRSFAGMVFHVFFALGYPLLALMAYYIRDWRTLCVISALSGVVVVLMWRLIPESPRWLLLNGREDEARAVLERIAVGNGKLLPASELKRPAIESSEKVSTLDLFRGKNIRHRTLILFWAWFTVCMVYYGLSMNAGNLGGDRYISFSLSGLIEIPSYVVAYFLVDRWGRKWTNVTFLCTGGLGCLAWALLHWLGSGGTVKLVMALVGKFAVSGSFALIYLFSAELFPTRIRNLGIGLCSSFARVGGIIAPLILLIAQYNEGLPMLLMGCLAMLTGLSTLSLPETLNQPLPETLAELELL